MRIYDETEKLSVPFLWTGTEAIGAEEKSVPLYEKNGLVHPVDLTKEQMDFWKKQFKKYSVKFLFGQLSLKQGKCLCLLR